MRLLNAGTLEITEFVDADNTPPYVILSHRWREGEVLFHHIDNLAEAEKLHGFSKLRKCCEKALQDDFDWVWIDTCCIDKTSSSELSEAINSMYSWYRKSEVCYAYLDDVNPDGVFWDSSFAHSEWFNRGWTLQELIAPNQVVFFAKDWSEIGTRKSLVDKLNTITLIDHDVLLGLKLPVELCVAQRMLWVSRRKTTRVEDMAYCLMGLFDVHMPTIYGEGKQAFIRLQHEIMRSTTDHTIFAWANWDYPEDFDVRFNVLASYPDLFQRIRLNTPDRIPYEDFARLFRMDSYSPEYTATNHGIRIRLPVKEVTLPNGEHEYTAALACCIADQILLGLRLRRVKGTTDQYSRVGILTKITNLDPESFTMKDLYLAYHSRSRALRGRSCVSIMLLPVDTLCRYSPRQVCPQRRWAVGTRGELSLKVANVRAGRYCAVAMLQQENEHGNEEIGVVFGVDCTQDREPRCIRASLIISDVGKGAWSTISPRPVVLCTSSSDQEAASSIWRKYQYEDPHEWDLYIDLQRIRLRRFHQISLERGSRVVHLTTDTYIHPDTNERILEARIVSHATSYSGWNLVWFLGSIIRHIPTLDLRMTVWVDIGSPLTINRRTQLVIGAFFFEEGDWIREIPEAMLFMTRPAEELWRTYFEKVKVYTTRSNNADGDGAFPVYRYGTVKVLEDDFRGVAAHFDAAIRSAWEVPAPPSFEAIIKRHRMYD